MCSRKYSRGYWNKYCDEKKYIVLKKFGLFYCNILEHYAWRWSVLLWELVYFFSYFLAITSFLAFLSFLLYFFLRSFLNWGGLFLVRLMLSYDGNIVLMQGHHFSLLQHETEKLRNDIEKMRSELRSVLPWLHWLTLIEP